MRELNISEVEAVEGGILPLLALAVFDVVVLAYDAYQLGKILKDK